MYRINYTDYGLSVALTGDLTKEETREWCSELIDLIESYDEPFGLLFDVRNFSTAEEGMQSEYMQVVQAMNRADRHYTSLIVGRDEVARRAEEIVEEGGLQSAIRIFRADRLSNWKAEAESWLREHLRQDEAP